MKLIYQLIKYFWFILILSIGLGQNKLELENNNDETWNVLYTSFLNIGGFQFNVDGATVISASGGAAETAGFSVTLSPTLVIGSSLSGTTILPAIETTLVILELSGSPTGLSGIVISDSDGEDLDFIFEWDGCTDDSACNYDENATIDNGASCTYPASDLVDCDGNCCAANDPECDMAHPADCAGVCDGGSTNVEICTGCLDDGFQQWSPNPGSPACNYAQFAIIEGECLSNDCNGECGGSAQKDQCGICGGGATTGGEAWCGETASDNCCDCLGIPNGSAYLDACDICVGGDTGISDCVTIEIESGVLLESDSDDNYIPIFATNLDTLRSLDIEFTYDSNIINISDFSLYGTALNPIGSDYYDYEIAYDSFIEAGNFIKVNFTLYFEPHTNLELFSSDGRENIFNIILQAMDINAGDSTQLIIKELSVNEILMDDSNWEGGKFFIEVPTGCMDDGYQQWSLNLGSPACNYDPNAREDDGSCAYELDCNGACGGPLLNTCIGGDGDDQSTCETNGGYWSVLGYNICEVCGGIETNSDNCTCTEENIIYDCNGDCPPIEDCPDEFSFTEGCAFKDTNCSDVCVGGATERDPCEQDCVAILLSTEEWGGIAYEDNCGVCISNTVETVFPEVLDSLDCFKSSFSIFNSNGIEINDLIVKESDTIYVVLQMQNLPDSLEGLILNIDYNSNDLFLNNWSLSPEEFNLEGELTGELNNSNELYIDIDSEFIDSTIYTAVMYTTNGLYQGNGGNMLFLQFFNLGINGGSTVISYTRVQVNEHVMKEQNYTSQVIYFGDCYGVFNGETPLDECGECGGNGVLQVCGCGSPGEFGIPDGDCDCEGNTPADLYDGEGYNCEGELSLNSSLIPKSFALNQNYPNPFNPITYIQYSVPQFDFVTIEIININGQIIKTIVQSSHQPGHYEIRWDGTNQYGIFVPSGIYFYKLDADEFASVRKLVLLK